MTDRIQISGLELLLHCGVLPEETVRRQPFRFDIDVEMDLARPSETDVLTDTVNYGDVMALLSKTLTGERFWLLERLAGRTAELVLSDKRVNAVTVSVHKKRPPVPHTLESTGVVIRREQPVG